MRLIGAELVKLRRWSTWILVAVTALFQLLVGYVLLYFLSQIPPSGPEGEMEQAALRMALRPQFAVSGSLTTLASLGGALALVIGALLSAREYGWRTMTTLLTQGATRLQVFAGKIGALLVVLVLMVALTFAASIAGVAFVAAQTGGGLDGLPSASEFLIGGAVGLLIVGTWAALGYGLGYLLRSTGLAIGLGLVYALVIESIVSGFGLINETFRAVSRGLLGTNGSSLAASFGPDVPSTEFGVVEIEPAVATAVLVAYLVASLAVGAFVLLRRDVT